MPASVIHLLPTSHADTGLCGAVLLPEDTDPAEWNWSDDLADVTCEDCYSGEAEAQFDRQEDRGYGAEDYAIDRAVELSRGIE